LSVERVDDDVHESEYKDEYLPT